MPGGPERAIPSLVPHANAIHASFPTAAASRAAHDLWNPTDLTPTFLRATRVTDPLVEANLRMYSGGKGGLGASLVGRRADG